MGQKRGVVPAHIKPKIFVHPQPDLPWILILNQVQDPRKPSCNTRYSLTSILFIVFVTVLCGAKNWEESHVMAEGFADWFRSYIDLPESVPSSATLERVTALIPTAELLPLLNRFAAYVKIRKVAIDGKTLCGTRGWDKGHPLHLLHAWESERGLCLTQVEVSKKSNEITALPVLIDQLELKGAIATADALHTHTTTVEALVAKGADYVLPVKKNQRLLLEDIELLFAEADNKDFKGIDAACTETTEKNGGRVESRQYALLSAKGLPGVEAWAKCACVGRVVRQRYKDGKTTEETCHYITSLKFDIEQFAQSVRGHWGVENGLHWTLDVVFREDNHRYQKRVGAANLSLMRKVAMTLLKRDTTARGGCATRQVKAFANSVYRDHLLQNCFEPLAAAS